MEADSKTYKNHNISIEYDESPMNPREDDNICIFHIAHRNYSFGDENYNDSESIHEAEKEAKSNGDITLPLYMYDHSGITISLSPFSCRWDSGQVGFVQIPRERMLEEFSSKIFTPKLKEKAEQIAQGEVDIFDSFLRGEVYGYIIDDDGDSCWGYYSIEDAMKDAEETIDYTVKDNIKKHCEKLKSQIKHKTPYYARESLVA